MSTFSKKFGKKVHDVFERSKRWIVYASVSCAVFAHAFPHEWLKELSPVLALPASIVIVEILIRTEARVLRERRAYSNFEGARTAIARKIKDALAARTKCEIRWMGVTMAYAWTFLEASLFDQLKDAKCNGIDIGIAMLDPDWEEIESINSDWARRVKDGHKRVTDWIDGNKKLMADKKITINVFRYRHIPCIHGVLINGDVLFVGLAKWEELGGKLQLLAAERQIELVKRRSDKADQIGSFLSWFTRCMVGTEIKRRSQPIETPILGPATAVAVPEKTPQAN